MRVVVGTLTGHERLQTVNGSLSCARARAESIAEVNSDGSMMGVTDAWPLPLPLPLPWLPPLPDPRVWPWLGPSCSRAMNRGHIVLIRSSTHSRASAIVTVPAPLARSDGSSWPVGSKWPGTSFLHRRLSPANRFFLNTVAVAASDSALLPSTESSGSICVQRLAYAISISSCSAML